MLVGMFGTTLIVVLVILDWIQFTMLSDRTTRYGCRVARQVDLLPLRLAVALNRFDEQGLLALPNGGIARCVRTTHEIILRPQYRLLSQQFRTAWPLKATIELQPADEATRLVFTKRMPWSSAIITLLWFLLVAIGTLAFFVAFLATGGLTSLAGILLALGVIGLGLLVLSFGLVIVAVAYRLEDARLRQAYDDLRDALNATLSLNHV
jgi:hypothetical protein